MMKIYIKWASLILGAPFLVVGSALIIINSNIWFYLGLVIFLLGWTLEAKDKEGKII